MLITGEDRWSFDDYIDHVNGDDIKIIEKELEEKKSSNKIYGQYEVFYD